METIEDKKIIWDPQTVRAKFKVWDKVAIDLGYDERDYWVVTDVTVRSEEVTYIVNDSDVTESRMDFANEYEIKHYIDKVRL